MPKKGNVKKNVSKQVNVGGVGSSLPFFKKRQDDDDDDDYILTTENNAIPLGSFILFLDYLFKLKLEKKSTLFSSYLFEKYISVYAFSADFNWEIKYNTFKFMFKTNSVERREVRNTNASYDYGWKMKETKTSSSPEYFLELDELKKKLDELKKKGIPYFKFEIKISKNYSTDDVIKDFFKKMKVIFGDIKWILSGYNAKSINEQIIQDNDVELDEVDTRLQYEISKFNAVQNQSDKEKEERDEATKRKRKEREERERERAREVERKEEAKEAKANELYSYLNTKYNLNWTSNAIIKNNLNLFEQIVTELKAMGGQQTIADAEAETETEAQEPGQPGGKKHSKREVLGKTMVIYKIKGDRKEYVKHKGKLITIKDYKALMKQKAKKESKPKKKKKST